MRLEELTYLADQIVSFWFNSLELRNKASEVRKLRTQCAMSSLNMRMFVNFPRWGPYT